MEGFKKTVISFIFICLVVILCCLLGGCCTQGHGHGDALIDHQREIDRLEEELRSRDRAIENAVRELGEITSRSESMEGTVDEIIRLFNEYQRRVDKMLWEYERIRGDDNLTETKAENAD